MSSKNTSLAPEGKNHVKGNRAETTKENVQNSIDCSCDVLTVKRKVLYEGG